jgi:Sucrase/ferredoxin-like
MEADRIGIRVQLIRRPGYRETRGSVDVGAEIYAAWTSGPEPWVRGLGGHVWDPDALDLVGIAEGIAPPEAVPADPLYLVCAHARRDRCCGRFGAPLARELAARYPARVWETTHLGGHKHAANIALLPHGLYYGPVDLPAALDAIEAYEGGEVTAHRYRGRAGRDEAWQEAEFAALLAGGGRGPA